MAGLTRRDFLKSAAISAGSLTFVGTQVLRGAPPSEKLNVAIVGAGGRGGAHIGGARSENIVALCDIDANRLSKAAEKLSGIRKYADYRQMLAEMGDKIDVVCVATPDHTHAVVAMEAMKAGKHVYVEKPLTHSIAEARALTEAARKYKVMTQMGNQGHSGGGYHVLCEWIWAGAIGEVKEIHSWTDRPIWPQGMAQRPEAQKAPDHVNWDLWIGPAPYREYHQKLHPFDWRGWWDFGCGALGDMGCHIMDGAFWSMQLNYPSSAELVDSSEISDQTLPKWSHVVLHFPARKPGQHVQIDLPAVDVHWWDGKHRPPMVDELEKKYDRKLTGNGTIYVGTEGIMYTNCYGGGVCILDPKAHEAFKNKSAPQVLERAQGGHFGDFFRACRDGKPSLANFDYAGPFTEAVLMGNLCLRAGKGKTVQWDGENMKVTNHPELNQYVKRAYREGWSL